MIKKDYIDRISEKTGYTKKDVNVVVSELFDLMAQDLKNQESITITNFGTFDVTKTKAMNVYSPYDGKLVRQEEQLRVHFKASNFIKK